MSFSIIQCVCVECEAIKDLIGCLLNVPNLLCNMLIGDQCDCNAGSDVSMSLSGIDLTCAARHSLAFHTCDVGMHQIRY